MFAGQHDAKVSLVTLIKKETDWVIRGWSQFSANDTDFEFGTTRVQFGIFPILLDEALASVVTKRRALPLSGSHAVIDQELLLPKPVQSIA